MTVSELENYINDENPTRHEVLIVLKEAGFGTNGAILDVELYPYVALTENETNVVESKLKDLMEDHNYYVGEVKWQKG